MAKTPRASKVSDATAPGTTKPAKTTAAKKKAATAAEQAPASRKAAKKAAASARAPASKQAGKKQAASAQAPASKKAGKKQAASAQAPAPKKAAKKQAASAQAPAPKKKAAKKPAVQAPVSEQLAFDLPASDSAPAPARPLQPGDRVPAFSLQADDGQTYSRQSLAGERFVIYFYPKDDTPGCTREACAFRDNRPRFDAAGVKVLGVSGDSLKSHDRFRNKYELNFPLLADPDRTVAQAFGAVGAKKLYGKTSVGIIRSTFLVGPEGIVERTFAPVKVDGHAEAVLQAIGSG